MKIKKNKIYYKGIEIKNKPSQTGMLFVDKEVWLDFNKLEKRYATTNNIHTKSMGNKIT